MCRAFDCSLASFMHVSVYLEAEFEGRVTMSVPRISNNSFWGFGSASVSRFTNFLDFNFMFTTSSSTSTPSTAAATTMELYRRARGVLPFVFTFIRTVDP